MADQVLILQVRDLTTTRRDIGVETGTPGDWAARVLDPDSLAALADVLAELQGGISVNAVNLDTRPLTFATDKVDVSGSTVLNAVLTDAHDNPNNALRVNVVATTGGGLTDTELRAVAVPVSGTVSVQDGGNVISVDAVDLDIRNLVFATDKVDASGSSVSVSNFPATQPVNGTVTIQDGGNIISVDAVDFDIRNLTFAADKVDASGTVLGAGNNNIGDVDVASLPTTAAQSLTDVESNNGPFLQDVNEDHLLLPSLLFAWNGTSWVRIRGDVTNGLDVDVTRLPSATVAGSSSLPAGTNNIGDVDIASIAAGTTRIGGTYTISGQIIDNDGDVLTVKVAHLDMTTATTTDIVAAVATKKIRVLNWEISTLEPATVTDVNFATGAGTTRVTGSGKVRMTAENLTTSRVAAPGAFLFETVAGEALRVTQTGATDLTASVTYVEV